MRYVGYVRISSEDQRGNYSLDAQKRAITQWVASQTGDTRRILSKFYEGEAYTGTTDDRPALGIHMQYGGGLAGFIASSDDPKFVYQYPSYMGSIVPGSVPGEFGFGHCVYKRTAYVSRENGNDFEGTGAGLWGITAAVYMALMGPQGFRELGAGIMQRSHYAARVLSQIDGIAVPGISTPFFKEFVVNFDNTGKPVAEINRALRDYGIFGGKDLSQEFPQLGASALYCVTELITKSDIDKLAQSLRAIIGS